MKTHENPYPCSDLYLSCYLRAKYHLPIADLDRDPHSGRVTFVFEAKGLDIQAAVREFFNGDAMVNVRAFCEEIGALKSLIHNYRSA